VIIVVATASATLGDGVAGVADEQSTRIRAISTQKNQRIRSASRRRTNRSLQAQGYGTPPCLSIRLVQLIDLSDLLDPAP
jgi:hypothetical protein